MGEELWEEHAEWWIEGFTDGADPPSSVRDRDVVDYARAVAPVRQRRQASEALARLRDGAFAAAGLVRSVDEVVAKLVEREVILSPGIGGAVAVPDHLMADWVAKLGADTGIFAAASSNASRASSSDTPCTSYRTLPGWIWATQYSTLPLPLP